MRYLAAPVRKLPLRKPESSSRACLLWFPAATMKRLPNLPVSRRKRVASCSSPTNWSVHCRICLTMPGRGSMRRPSLRLWNCLRRGIRDLRVWSLRQGNLPTCLLRLAALLTLLPGLLLVLKAIPALPLGLLLVRPAQLLLQWRIRL